MILSAVGVVIAMIAAALAVDLGRLASDKRTDQKLADMAALDASRDVTAACKLARDSIERHGLPRATLTCTEAAPTNAPGDDVLLGKMSSAGAFVPDLTGDVVQVKVRSSFQVAFAVVSGPNKTSGKAAAGLRNPASFSLGSGVASIDTTRSTLLNSIIGQMLCSPVCATGDAGVSLASWQGLATGRMSLTALQTSLANAGFSVGSVDQLMSASMTLADLYTATASALTTGGDTADANIFTALALKATSTVTITLGQLIHVQQGADSAALGTSINLMQLVTGTAEIANGSHLIDVSNVGITVPGVTSTRVQMTVIEKPVIFIGYFGDAGVTTAQINLTVTPTLNLSIVGVATITGALPIAITGGSATGALAAQPSCPSAGSKSFNVSVATTAAAVTQSSSLTVVGLGLLNTSGNVTVAANPAVTTPTPPAAFVEQGTTPQSFVPTTAHTGGTSLGLGTALTLSSGVGAINAILSLLLSPVKAVVNSVDSSIIEPLLQALGIDVGNADVTPLSVRCGQPSLLG